MKSTIKSLVVLVVLTSVVSVGGAFAARNSGGGGRIEATISFAIDGARLAAPRHGDSVWFSVDPLRVKDRDLGHLWVSNVCWQDGVPVMRADLGVDYPSYREGVSGAFALGGPTWGAGEATCSATVYLFGDGPLDGATFSYQVTG